MISIIVPIYKYTPPHTLKRTIESIIQDINKEDELIISADGALDHAYYEIIENYYQTANCEIKFLESNGNPKGIIFPLNRAVKEARHNIIARMDADDEWVKNRRRLTVDFMSNQSIDLLCGDILEFISDDRKDIFIKKGTHINKITPFFFFRNPINHVSVSFRKDTFLELGGYKNIFRGEDWELWSRFIRNGKKIEYVSEIFAHVDCTSTPARRSGMLGIRSEISITSVFIKNFPLYLPILIIFFFLRVLFRFLPRSLIAAVYKNLRIKV